MTSARSAGRAADRLDQPPARPSRVGRYSGPAQRRHARLGVPDDGRLRPGLRSRQATHLLTSTPAGGDTGSHALSMRCPVADPLRAHIHLGARRRADVQHQTPRHAARCTMGHRRLGHRPRLGLQLGRQRHSRTALRALGQDCRAVPREARRGLGRRRTRLLLPGVGGCRGFGESGQGLRQGAVV